MGPAGTGLSRPAIDCVDDYDKYFGLDSSPDTPEERQALIDVGTEFGKSCRRKNKDVLPFISTANSARDMDSIRKALGEKKISYFGFSYGSELGTTWATLFPDTVRAAVGCLDDPGSTGPDDLYSHEAEFAAAAPRLGRGWMAELTFCSMWPAPAAAIVNITGRNAGPIVVVGTTGDPATPLESTRNMAKALEDGHLVVVTAGQHTGYGVNTCVNDVADNYLVDPAAALDDEIICD